MVTRKEAIKPPTRKELGDASKQLRKGHSGASFTMNAQKSAIKQGAAKPVKKSK